MESSSSNCSKISLPVIFTQWSLSCFPEQYRMNWLPSTLQMTALSPGILTPLVHSQWRGDIALGFSLKTWVQFSGLSCQITCLSESQPPNLCNGGKDIRAISFPRFLHGLYWGICEMYYFNSNIHYKYDISLMSLHSNWIGSFWNFSWRTQLSLFSYLLDLL